jgi:hypothetical protein
MDTVSQGQKGSVSSGSCYLMLPEIPGSADVGKVVKKGHPVVAYSLGASKANVPGENGLGAESARAIGTSFSVILQKIGTAQSSFEALCGGGENIPDLKVFNLRNHGEMAAEAFSLEFKNVRVVRIHINRKEEMGGYIKDKNLPFYGGEQGLGSGGILDENPNNIAQMQDPNAARGVADGFLIECSYDEVTLIYTELKPDGKIGGKVPAHMNYAKNTIQV